MLVCHVLRYTPFYKAVKAFIKSGKLGEVINVVHTEGVGNVHISHSFVRGNWRKEEESSVCFLLNVDTIPTFSSGFWKTLAQR